LRVPFKSEKDSVRNKLNGASKLLVIPFSRETGEGRGIFGNVNLKKDNPGQENPAQDCLT